MILVGQAPSRTSDPLDPLSGDPLATKLARMFGLSKADYLRDRRIERRNILEEWPGKAAKGDAFPRAEALAAAILQEREFRGRRVIFLGKGVARAFGFPTAEYLKWTPWFLSGIAAILPHPSGVNRWYNDGGNARRAKRFLRTALAAEAKRCAA